jgi:ribosomal protein L37E
VTHLVDPPSRTGNRPLPKVEEPPPSEETLVVRTHAREGEAEAEGEGEALPWDVVDEKKKETQPEAYGNKLARPPSVALESEMEPHAKEHTGNRCEECGRPIGPTAKLCAACRFPDTRKSAEWADARSEELAP